MPYTDPQRVYIVTDDQGRPILQVPEKQLSNYLKEKQKRESEQPTLPRKEH